MKNSKTNISWAPHKSVLRGVSLGALCYLVFGLAFSALSSPAVATAVLTPPSGLVAEPRPNKIWLAWDRPSLSQNEFPSHYQIYRGSAANFIANAKTRIAWPSKSQADCGENDSTCEYLANFSSNPADQYYKIVAQYQTGSSALVSPPSTAVRLASTAMLGANPTGSLSLSGQPSIGEWLTATLTDAANPVGAQVPITSGVTYQWQIQDPTTSVWSNAPGSSNQRTYQIPKNPALSSRRIRVQATYSDFFGQQRSLIQATQIAWVIQKPRFAIDQAIVGHPSRIRIVHPDPTSVTITGQRWYHCRDATARYCVIVLQTDGGTNPIYHPTQADYLGRQYLAAKISYTAPGYSGRGDWVGNVLQVVNLHFAPVTYQGGTSAAVGVTLRAGDVTNPVTNTTIPATYTWEWCNTEYCNVEIANLSNQRQYRVNASQLNSWLRVRARVNIGGRTSDVYQTVTVERRPTISGDVQEGGVVSVADLTKIGATSAATYQWQIADTATGTWRNAPGKSNQIYYAIADDQSLVGKYLRALVISGGTTHASYGRHINNVDDPGVVQISDTYRGLSAKVISLTDPDAVSSSNPTGRINPSEITNYRWEVCDRATGLVACQNAATTSTYVPTLADVNSPERDHLRLTLRYDDPYDQRNATSIPTQINPTEFAPLTGLPAQVGNLLRAGAFSLGRQTVTPSYAWQRCTDANCSSSDGHTVTDLASTSRTYRVQLADQNQYLRVRATATRGSESVTLARIVRVDRTGQIGSISGLPVEGGSLSIDPVQDPDGTPSNVRYKWQVADTHDAQLWATAPGVFNNQTYQISDSQELVGKYLRVQAIYDQFGGGELYSPPTVAVANLDDPGTVEISPTITATPSRILSITDPDAVRPENPSGSIDTSAILAYQWEVCGQSVRTCRSVSTAPTYAPSVADQSGADAGFMRVSVTYTDPHSTSVVARSTPLARIIPFRLAAISGLPANVDSVLRAGDAHLDGAVVTAEYRWQRCVDSGCTSAPQTVGTSRDYTLVAADQNHYLRVRASANYQGETIHLFETVRADRSGRINPSGGQFEEGGTVVAGSVQDPDGTPQSNLTYQWQVADQANGVWEVASGDSTAGHYEIPDSQALVGKYLRVQVSYSDFGGGVVHSPPIAVHNVDDPGTVRIDRAWVGLESTPQVDDPDQISRITTYQWQLCTSTDLASCSDIASAAAQTYTPAVENLNSGDYLSVTVGYDDQYTTARSVRSVPKRIYAVRFEGIAFSRGSVADVGVVLRGGDVVIPRRFQGEARQAANSYLWQSCDNADCSGTTTTVGNAREYTVRRQDRDKWLRVRATTQHNGDQIALEQIIATDRSGSFGVITGSVVEGSILTAGALSDPDGSSAPQRVTYQWQQSDSQGGAWVDAPGVAHQRQYQIAADQSQVGKFLRVRATYSEFGGGDLIVAASTAVANVNDPARIYIDRAVVGQASRARIEDPDGGAISVSGRQWQICTKRITPIKYGPHCENVSPDHGGKAETYTPANRHAGKFLRILMSYTSPGDSGSGEPSAINLPITTASFGAITYSSGNLAKLGVVLSAGDVTPAAGGVALTASYQWQRCTDAVCSSGNVTDISGHNTRNYEVRSQDLGKYLRVRATATHNGANLQLYATVQVDKPGSMAALSGTAEEGGLLVAGQVQDGDGRPEVSYQWQVADAVNGNWQNAPGNATQGDYAIADDQSMVGKYLRVSATYANAGGGTLVSDPSPQIANVDDPGRMASISGIAQEGGTLTAGAVTDADGTPTVTYTWQVAQRLGGTWATAPGNARQTTYQIPSDQSLVGKYLRLKATYANVGGGELFSQPSVAVANVDDVAVVRINAAVEGAASTASVQDPDGTPANIRYAWAVCSGTNPASCGATMSTAAAYTVPPRTQRQVGGTDFDYLMVSINYDTPYTQNKSAASAVLPIIKAEFADLSGLPADIGSTLRAGDVTVGGTRLAASYRWQRCSDANCSTENGNTVVNLVGENARVYRVRSDDQDHFLRVLATVTHAGGTHTLSKITAAEHGGRMDPIIGTPVEGGTLRAGQVHDPEGEPSVSYQWQIADSASADDNLWRNAPGASNVRQYQISATQSMVGKFLRVRASYADFGGGVLTSAATAAIANVDDPGTLRVNLITVDLPTTYRVFDPDAVTDANPTGAIASGDITRVQWQVCDQNGNCGNSVSAATYTPTYQDQLGASGGYLRLTVDYHDPHSRDVRASNVPLTPIGGAEFGAVTGLPANVGATLSAADVTLRGAVLPATYAWQRCASADCSGTPTALVSTREYTVATEDLDKYFKVEARADLGDGNFTTVFKIIRADRSGSISAVRGVMTEGGSLIAGDVNDPDGGAPSAISYVWQQTDDPVNGPWVRAAGDASSATYRLAHDQTHVGKYFRVLATYTDFGGGTVDSAATAAIANVDDVGTLRVNAPVVGFASQFRVTDPDGAATGITYEWQACPDSSGAGCNAIAEATTPTYTPERNLADDPNRDHLRVQVRYNDPYTSGVVLLSAAQKIAVAEFADVTNLPANLGTELIAGEVTLDGIVTAATYQWQRCATARCADNPITVGSSRHYQVQNADLNQHLRVQGTVRYLGNPITLSKIIAADRSGSIAAISGSVAEGGSLTAGAVQDADGTPAITYQWQVAERVDNDSWQDAPGISNTTTYAIADDQSLVGKYLRVRASYREFGGGELFSAPSVAIANVDDIGVARIDRALVGAQSSVEFSDPDGSTSAATYQWQVCEDAAGTTCRAIANATATNYTPTVGDYRGSGGYLRAQVTYNDPYLNARVVHSTPMRIIPATFAGITFDSGSAANVGTRLSAGEVRVAGGVNAVAATYQWQRCADARCQAGSVTDLSGQTLRDYTLVAEDQNHYLRVKAAFTFNGATAEVFQGVLADRRGAMSALSGNAEQGGSLSAGVVSDPEGTPTPTYQWSYADDSSSSVWQNAPGASTARIYQIPDDQSLVGKYLRVVAAYSDFGGGRLVAISDAIADVDDPGQLAPISGTPEEGGTLTAGAVLDPEGNPTDVTWQWQVSDDGIDWRSADGVATQAQYQIAADQSAVGKHLRVVATYGEFGGGNPGSAAVQVANVDDVGQVAVNAAVVGLPSEARISDADGALSAVVYQWQACPDSSGSGCADINAATEATYTPLDADRTNPNRDHLRLRVTYNDPYTNQARVFSTPRQLLVGSFAPISGLPATEGRALQAGAVILAGSAVPVEYQWQRCVEATCQVGRVTDISLATARVYRVQAEDRDHYLRVRATVTHAGATFALYQTIRADSGGRFTQTLGAPVEGATLRVMVVDPDGVPNDLSYQWEVSDDPQNGTWLVAPQDSGRAQYTLPDDQSLVGKYLRVVVFYTDAGGGSLTSSASIAVRNADDAGVVETDAGGFAEVGVVNRVTSLTDADGGIRNRTYQWQLCNSANADTCADISAATGDAYTPRETDRTAPQGGFLRVVVNYDDAYTAGVAAYSTPKPLLSVSLDPMRGLPALVGQRVSAGEVRVNGNLVSANYAWHACFNSTCSGNNAVTTLGTQRDQTVVYEAARNYLRVRATVTHSGNTYTRTQTVPSDRPGRLSDISGDFVEGGLLTAGAITDPDGAPRSDTIRYRWHYITYENGQRSEPVAAPGVNDQSTYQIADDQSLVGAHMIVTVVYPGSGGGDPISSPLTVAIANADDPGTVSIDRAEVGLPSGVASLVDPDGNTSRVRYQWQLCPDSSGDRCRDAQGSGNAAASYTPNYAHYANPDQDHLRLVVTYDDPYSTAVQARSTPTRIASSELAAISGLPANVGRVLTAGIVTPPGGGAAIAATYQWLRCATLACAPGPSTEEISGEVATTYAVTAADRDKYIGVRATFSRENHRVSLQKVIAADRSGSVAIMGRADEGNTINATAVRDPDGNPSRSAYQWQIADAANGPWQTAPGTHHLRTYAIARDGSAVGKHLRVQASYREFGGGVVHSPSVQVANVYDSPSISIDRAVAGLPSRVVAQLDVGMRRGSYYSWQICTPLPGGACREVSSATVYTPSFNHVGKNLRVQHSILLQNGALRYGWSPLIPILDVSLSQFLSFDDITYNRGNAANIGITLRAGDAKTSTGSVRTAEYQWQRCADAVCSSGRVTTLPEQIERTYQVQAADQDQWLRVVARARHNGVQTLSKIVRVDRRGQLAEPSGSVQEGGRVLAGTFNDPDGVPNLTYQWQIADNAVVGPWRDAPGDATQPYYDIADDQSQIGKYLRVTVTYSEFGGGVITSTPTQAISNVDDVGRISALTGELTQGKIVLAGQVDDPDGSVTATYQWEYADTAASAVWNVAPGTSTSRAYRITHDQVLWEKYLRVVVRYNDAGGGRFVQVFKQAIPNGNRAATSTLALAGSVAEGETVRLSGGISDPDGVLIESDITYIWEQSDDGVNGWAAAPNASNARTYAIASDQSQVGKHLRVRVTYIKFGGGEFVVQANATIANTDDAGASTLTLNGRVTEGATLRLTGAVSDPDGTLKSGDITYIWEQSDDGVNGWVAAPNASNSREYTIAADQSQVGKHLRVRATYAKFGGGEFTVQANTAVVDTEGMGTSTLAIDGSIAEGETLRLTGAVSDPDGTLESGDIAYIWEQSDDGMRDWAAAPNASNAREYSIAADQSQVGKHLRVRAVYTKFGGGEFIVRANAAVANTDDAGTSTLALDGRVGEGETLRLTGAVSDPDGDLAPSDITYIWEQSDNGANNSWAVAPNASNARTYAIAADQSQVGKRLRVRATYAKFGGGEFIVTATTVIAETDDSGSSTLAIDGVVAEGETLRLTGAISDPDGDLIESDITYIWEQSDDGVTDWAAAPNASNAREYAIAADQSQAGKHLRVRTVYAKFGGGEFVVQASTPIADTDQVGSSTLAIEGSVAEGETIRLSGALSDPDGSLDSSDVTYVWEQSDSGLGNWNPAPNNADAREYAIASDQSQVGKYLRVRAVYTKFGGGEFIVQAASAVQDTNDPGSLSAITGDAKEGGTLTAGEITDPDQPTGLLINVVNLITYQWQVADAINGPWRNAPGDSTARTYQIGSDQSLAGKYLRVVVTYTAFGGGSLVSEPSAAVVSLPPPLSDLGIPQVTEDMLPKVTQTVVANVVSAINARISSVSSEMADAHFQINGLRDWASIVKTQAEAEMNDEFELRRALSDSNFALPLKRASDEAESEALAGIWGKGVYQSVSGETDRIAWDGELSGFHLGTDRKMSEAVFVGFAISHQRGDFQVTQSNDEQHQYQLSITSANPYFGWRRGGLNIFGSLGVGRGDGELQSKTDNSRADHALSSYIASIGASGEVVDLTHATLRLKGELLHNQTAVEGDNAAKNSFQNHRLRLALEAVGEARTRANGGGLTPSAELALRADRGAAEHGRGLEVGGGLHYHNGRVRWSGNLRHLLTHSNARDEWGAQGSVRLESGKDGQGLGLEFAPSYGQVQSGVETLWQDGVVGATPDPLSAAPTTTLRADARIQYGFQQRVYGGLFAPYAEAQLGEAQRLGLGLNWALRERNLDLDLKAERSPDSAQFILRGSLEF